MRDILKTLQTAYVDAQTLLNLLAGYRKPRGAILRMVKNRDLIRLKNGFYLIADKMTSIPYEQIANLLYGPSYVSLEWALSFYGMIPERVHTITSMTLGKNKAFQTSIGDFTYSHLTPQRYSVGITYKQAVDAKGGFLMATPEKALADLVFTTCKGLDKKELREELLESKRIDPEVFSGLNKNLLCEIGASYGAKSINHLMDLIGTL